MAQKVVIEQSLTEREFKELIHARRDPFYFSSFCFVVHPVRGKTRFELYEFQKKVLYYFLKKRFNIILKFRQAGITELISMYCLWLAMYFPNKKINIISIKDTVAKKVLKKIKYMYKNLPAHLQVPIINGRSGEYGTSTTIEFINGSFIDSIPTTEDAGRSESLSLLVIDEAAIVRWASSIWAAAFPTLSTGGSAIVNSTPYGVGNFYHSKWTEAITDVDSVFNPVRLKWDMHPERDIKWYDEMAAALGPKRTAQEIDGDFLNSGTTVFDLTDIKAIEDTLSEWPVLKSSYNGQLKIFDVPLPDTEYYIGADVATGRATDYSSFTLGDKYGVEAAIFKGKIPVNRYSRLLGDTGRTFNNACIAPETNDIGLAVTSWLQDNAYPNLYYHTAVLKQKGKRKPKTELVPGWITHTGNRTMIIDELEQDIRTGNYTCKDAFFVQEAYTFIYDGMGRPVAMNKHDKKSNADGDLEDETYSDDDIFGKAIYNRIRKRTRKNIVVTPQ